MSIYSDDEGALNSKKLQTFFQEEGLTHVIAFQRSGSDLFLKGLRFETSSFVSSSF